MPSIFYPKESHFLAESKNLKSPVSVPRKSLTKRVYQQDQFKLFQKQDKIKRFDVIDSTLKAPGYTFQKYDNGVVFYRFGTNVLYVPEVTGYVRVYWDLPVKFFYKDSLLPLRSGFVTECTVVLQEKVWWKTSQIISD